MMLNFLQVTFLFFQSVMHPSSDQADKIYGLFRNFNIAAFSMLFLVTGLTVFICIRFRKKKDDDSTAEQFRNNNLLEAFMIGIPTILVCFFYYRTIVTMKALEPSVEKYPPADIVVIGHQFWWEVRYPASGVITANEVHLPVNKKILLELRSADVIHDWWVPELGNKMDLVPGRVNHLWLKVNEVAEYIGACSEFCGAQHAWMRLNVIAETEPKYKAWLARNALPANRPAEMLAMKGARIFEGMTCANCHRVGGTSARGVTGPDLSHYFSRQKMLAGMMELNEANTYKWISDPQSVKPGSLMPKFLFSRDTLNAIVSYMTQLK